MGTTYYVAPGGSDGNTTTQAQSLSTPWATVAHGVATMAGGDTLYIQNGINETPASPLNPPAGSAGSPTRILGFNASPGDLDGVINSYAGFPVLSYGSTADLVFDSTSNYLQIRNLVLDGKTGGFYGGLVLSGGGCWCDNLCIKNFKTYAVQMNAAAGGTPSRLSRILALANKSGASGAFFNYQGASIYIDLFVASALSCPGMTGNLQNTIGRRSICANLTGSSSHGVSCTSFGPQLDGFVAYKCGGDGIQAAGPSGNNSILYGNGGYGINSPTVNWSASTVPSNYNAFGSNATADRNQYPAGANDITGISDPFANGTGSINTLADALANFALSVAGKTALGGKGWPTNLDIGAVQSSSSGGVSSTGVSAARIMGGL